MPQKCRSHSDAIGFQPSRAKVPSIKRRASTSASLTRLRSRTSWVSSCQRSGPLGGISASLGTSNQTRDHGRLGRERKRVVAIGAFHRAGDRQEHPAQAFDAGVEEIGGSTVACRVRAIPSAPDLGGSSSCRAPASKAAACSPRLPTPTELPAAANSVMRASELISHAYELERQDWRQCKAPINRLHRCECDLPSSPNRSCRRSTRANGATSRTWRWQSLAAPPA